MKHIHFIGICGVAMSALAIAFTKKGYTVTGSDAGFYLPVSTNLLAHKIPFYPGWHVDKMTKLSIPDLVIVGNVASSSNLILGKPEKLISLLSLFKAVQICCSISLWFFIF